MARIIGGGMIGELSGKLGGNVFARNKSGAYIRQYVVPVDPNTQAQADARVAFGTSSSSYHSLDSLTKNQWQSFAQNLYLPKTGANTGQFSGFNAFTALRNTAQNGNRILIATPTVLVNGTPNIITDITPYNYTNTPPANSIQGNLQLTGTLGTTQLNLSGSSINTLAEFSFQVSMGNTASPTPSSITPRLTNGANQPIGFAVYMSNPVQQEQMFIVNPEKFCLGYIPNFTLETGTNTSVENINISGSGIQPANYQSWISEGDFVRITVYMTTLDGQAIRIGSQMTIVSLP